MHWNKACAVIGVQWGDEGKGKLVDILAGSADVVVRATGGNNAGHTVVVGDKKYVSHIIPSGILHPNVDNVVAHGVVVDPHILGEEMEAFQKKGISLDRLKISDSAHVITRYHRDLDIFEELVLRGEGEKIGTTQRGIGPTYADKARRVGFFIEDLYDKNVLGDKLKTALKYVNMMFKAFGITQEKYVELFTKKYKKEHGETDFSYYTDKGYDLDKLVERYYEYGKRIMPHVRNTVNFLEEAIDSGKKVLFEGAQGILLDVDVGTYPFCTSSNPGVGGMISGSGLIDTDFTKVIGIVKAYMTRVGTGMYPTKLDHTKGIGRHILEKGEEYGATTGRPRPCGWFDAVATKYALRRVTDKVAITKLDVLDELDEIKVCLSYTYDGPDVPYDGKILKRGDELTHFPTSKRVQPYCIPRDYYTQPGWKESIVGITDHKDLPSLTKRYVNTICGECGVEPGFIYTGKKRNEIIVL